MNTVATIVEFLEQLAPFHLAEEWDNVGLLVGRRERTVQKVMTCLTITPASAAEAVAAGADLIVVHHPLPFAPLKRLTDDTTAGRLLLELIAARVAVFSAHTAFDSAGEGINQQLAEGLGLRRILPLMPQTEGNGSGRFGVVEGEIRLRNLVDRLKRFLSIEHLHIVGELERNVRRIAVACGAAGEFLKAARDHGCDALVVGEARFHTCLEAEASGIALLLPGHFASERFAMEHLAKAIARQFPPVEVWASRTERDPIQWQ